MCVCVCVPDLRVLVTSGVIWCDIDRVELVKQVSWLFPTFIYFIRMTLAIDKMDGHGHINTACPEYMPKKTKVLRY